MPHPCSDIPANVINNTTILSHNGIGVVISKRAKIGRNVFIGQHVTIGNDVIDNKPVAPVIEDNVVIYPHSHIFGNITIGHDSVVGAGSLVTKSVPSCSLVIGRDEVFAGKYKDKPYVFLNKTWNKNKVKV